MAQLKVLLLAVILGLAAGARLASTLEYEDGLLACTDLMTEDRLIIAEGDKPYWDYMYETGRYYTKVINRYNTNTAISELEKFKSKLICTKITQPKVPDNLKCDKCASANTDKPSLWLSKCAAAKGLEDFKRIEEEVSSEGGHCLVGGVSAKGSVGFGKVVSECSASKVKPMGTSNFTEFYSCFVKSYAELKKDKAGLQADIVSLQESAQSIENELSLFHTIFPSFPESQHFRDS